MPNEPNQRYYIRAVGQREWQQVTRELWIAAERSAGFCPNLPRDHPDYMNICVTGGFSDDTTQGKIETR